MIEQPIYKRHLSDADDIITTYEEIREGFIKLALEKSRRAEPTIQEARQLQAQALQCVSVADLIQRQELQSALLTAAGFSDKAARYIETSDKDKAISEFAKQYLEPAGVKFVEELVFRYLLTRGDSLGGTMRNLAGALAQAKLIRCLTAQMRIEGTPFAWLNNAGNWLSEGDPYDIEYEAKGLSWSVNNEPRTLIFNSRIPTLGTTNIDLFLLRCECSSYREDFRQCDLFIALGELKGGIDPAGADEHWKTATKTLSRIRDHFEEQNYKPALLFIGAAIVDRMAKEIWDELEQGQLTNAANLNRDEQMASICSWLISL